MDTDTLQAPEQCHTVIETPFTVYELTEPIFFNDMNVTSSYDCVLGYTNNFNPNCPSTLKIGLQHRKNPNGSTYPHVSLKVGCQREVGHTGRHTTSSTSYDDPDQVSDHPFEIFWDDTEALDDKRG